MEIFVLKPIGCRKINSFFRNVKWCFNASWGLKGSTHNNETFIERWTSVCTCMSWYIHCSNVRLWWSLRLRKVKSQQTQNIRVSFVQCRCIICTTSVQRLRRWFNIVQLIYKWDFLCRNSIDLQRLSSFVWICCFMSSLTLSTVFILRTACFVSSIYMHSAHQFVRSDWSIQSCNY